MNHENVLETANEVTFQLLRTEFKPTGSKLKGYAFKQVWRDEDYAIYTQTHIQSGRIHAFDAFKITKQEKQTRTIDDSTITFPAKEHYPVDDDFGVIAFSCHTIERAQERIAEMKLKQSERTK